MTNRILICITVQIISVVSFAQNNIDTLLKQVENNNRSLSANQKYWEAKRAEFKTGLSLYDPRVEYDYLFGSPEGAGNQTEFSVVQRLDFPTAYKRKKELSNQQITQTEIRQSVFRQDILLEAKLLVLDIIYLNKRDKELNRRYIQTAQLLKDYEKKLEQGEVIILDVNKTKIQLLNIKNDVELNKNERQVALTKLSELNGGIAIEIKDTIYPPVILIPDFETLDSTIEANDPLIKVYEQEKLIQQKQIELQKAMNLPKIEAGYHSQGILGQTYRGIHGGISIPLWENKNRVKFAQANLDHVIANAERHGLEHRMENKRLYDLLGIRGSAMEEYREVLGSLNNEALLSKALRFGEITIVQYFLEQGFYYVAYDRYLQMEREYHKAVTELYKYQL